MIQWTVNVSDEVKKRLGTIQNPERTRIWTAIKMLRAGLYDSGLDVKKLRGRPEWRLRIGGWRILFLADNKKITITVISIGSRGDVYKK